MVKLCSILSIRNVLRTSGIIVLTVGAPMLVVTPLAVKFFFGKREDTQEPDKKVMNITMQAVGAALTASGAKSLLGPVSRQALSIALYEEALFACYHIFNRFSGRYKDAKGRMVASDFFAAFCSSAALLQILSLYCGDEPESEDDKDD